MGKLNSEKIVSVAVIATLTFMAVWGLISAVAEVRPFWVDEWRIIYNLKWKDTHALWGQLDYMQQFPRVYLTLVKAFTAALHYNYFSLRFPAYLCGLATILLSYRMSHRLFPYTAHRLLFSMVLVSSYTFTEYFVQTKQYTMEILLSVAAVWQLLELLAVAEGKVGAARYLLLCISMLVFPFFSYTYPIAIAPAYGVVLLCSLRPGRQASLLKLWLPLLLSIAAIAVFYVVDVSQLMADQGMRGWWGHLMLKNGFSFVDFFYNLFNLFAMIGSGLLFWIIFGIVGSCAFIAGLYNSALLLRAKRLEHDDLVQLYAVGLLLLVIALNLAGKLPVGEPRLNAFTIPSILVLIITLFDKMRQRHGALGIAAKVVPLVLFAGVIGNIYTTFIAAITGPVYEKRIATYRATQRGVAEAQQKQLPVFTTPAVAFPYDTTANIPFDGNVPGDWVITTFPAFNVAAGTTVCNITDTAHLDQCKSRTPGRHAAMVGDGLNYKLVTW